MGASQLAPTADMHRQPLSGESDGLSRVNCALVLAAL